MLIIKIGGGEQINLRGIVADLAELDEPVVLVHGANALRDRLAEALGRPRKMLTSVSGYTSVYSDESALDLLMLAYAGLRNKRLVELCQQHGINAIGLSGIDGQVIRGRRNRGIRVLENGKLRLVRDLSGKPQAVNEPLLRWLLEQGYTPVLTVPIVDERGTAINSENDDIVVVLQAALQARMVIQLIEASGFLEDPRDPASVVAALSRNELEQREAQVSGRMKRKMLALRRLFDNGAQRVVMADGRTEHPIRAALAGEGTVIQ
ncbi:MAG: [LysW]-aminoadipate kinase [candidate division KSB1 bacterium]|nr:[LysW]-aminoadipate kinase [candidate division KSB1 bacterium]